jgi:hypothetical protein
MFPPLRILGGEIPRTLDVTLAVPVLAVDLSTGASVVAAVAAMAALIFAWLTVKEARKAREEAGALAEQQIAEMAAQVKLMNEANEATVRQHKIELDHRHVAQLRQLAELLGRARDVAAKESGTSGLRPGLGLSELLLSIQISVGALSASGYTCPENAIRVASFSGRDEVDPAAIGAACALAHLEISAAFASWATDRVEEIEAGEGWTEQMQRR